MRAPSYRTSRVCITPDKDLVLDRCIEVMDRLGIDLFVAPNWTTAKQDGPRSRFLTNSPYAITAWFLPDNTVESLPLVLRDAHLVDYSFRVFKDDGSPVAEGVARNWLTEGRDAVSDTFEDLARSVAASLLIIYDRSGLLLRTCG